MSTNIGITIGISLISSIVLLTLALIIYNFVNNQPLFTIPWTNENAKLKDNISTNIASKTSLEKLSDKMKENIEAYLVGDLRVVKKENGSTE